MGNFSELDAYLFGQGTHYDIYKKLGAHPAKAGGKTGVNFAVWAPHAKRVFVIGEFNDWNETRDEMKRIEPEGIGVFETFLPEAKVGMLYKYLIETEEGEFLYKADPYANEAELRPGTASRITDGQIPNGCRKGTPVKIHTTNQWQFMKCIPVHGCVIRAERMRAFTAIGI